MKNTTTKPTSYRTINVKPETFELLQQLAEIVGTRYGKVNLGELTASLIKRELQTLSDN